LREPLEEEDDLECNLNLREPLEEDDGLDGNFKLVSMILNYKMNELQLYML